MAIEGIPTLLNSLAEFAYCPPSNNLWTVRICEHNYGNGERGKSLTSLYSNIISVNRTWNGSTFATQWKVDFPESMQKKIQTRFLNGLEGANGLFLASDITLHPFETTVNTSIAQEIRGQGGFLNMGNTLNQKVQGNGCNISFLVSNWQLGELLIEPWIAAILQRGLVESTNGPLDGNKSIKADIFILEYSASSDAPLYQNVVMKPRKQYTLFNAYPVKRGEVEYKYDQGTAGEYRKEIVQFSFDQYKTTYFDISR